jgi:predicted dehydrogenase
VKRVELCILGCGRVARHHSRVARSLGGAARLWYASRSKEKAEAYNRELGGGGAFGSYQEACASPSVDAVFICTPHALHLEHARLAARHRKPMLIEKPVVKTRQEFDALEALVAEAGVTCMVAENYFFKPAVAALRRHFGDIGRPLLIEVNRTNRNTITGWRADAEMMGGGALLEGGVHWVNYMTSLGGTVEAALAARPRHDGPLVAPFEDTLEVLLRYRSGAVGKLLHSWNLQNRTFGLSLSKIYGSHGNIVFETNGLWALVAGRRNRLRIPGPRDLMGFRAMLRHFVECVRDGGRPKMSLAVARHDFEIVMAAYRSLESGRFEAVPPPTGEPVSGVPPHGLAR